MKELDVAILENMIYYILSLATVIHNPPTCTHPQPLPSRTQEPDASP